MLIIAIPKSASTSLVHTLKRLHGLPEGDYNLRDNPIPEDFEVLSGYHSDMRELDRQQIDVITSEEEIVKHHIVPTDNNMSLLEEIPKVILLRDPEDVVRAYRRAEKQWIHLPKIEFEGCETEEEWLERSKEVGLLEELTTFHEKWQQDPNHIKVEFSRLIQDPKPEINRIEHYFGLPETEEQFALSKKRYTGSIIPGRFQFDTAYKKLKSKIHSGVDRLRRIFSYIFNTPSG